MQKAISIYELNMEFHKIIDSRFTEINKLDISYKEKIHKIREIRKNLGKEIKYLESDRYKEYLGSFAWDRKRIAVLKRANYCCEGCATDNAKLEVHHLTYERKGMELLTDLVAYCDNCHELAHKRAFNKESIEWWSYLILSSNIRPESVTKKEYEDMSEEDKKIFIINSIDEIDEI